MLKLAATSNSQILILCLTNLDLEKAIFKFHEIVTCYTYFVPKIKLNLIPYVYYNLRNF